MGTQIREVIVIGQPGLNLRSVGGMACMGCLAVLGACSAGNKATMVHRYVADWQSYDLVIAAIDLAAEWPIDRQLTDREWQSIIRVAVMFQRSDPGAVEAAIIAYMLTMKYYVANSRFPTHWRYRPEHRLAEASDNRERGDYGTNVMLILRVMFDIPVGDRPVLEIGAPGYVANPALPYGGFPHHLADLEGLDVDSLVAPVHWADGGPTLTAFYGPGPSGGGGTWGGYQPHWEYRYFLERYPYREGLEQFLPKPDDYPAPFE